jgi:hypothetical protein
MFRKIIKLFKRQRDCSNCKYKKCDLFSGVCWECSRENFKWEKECKQ